MGRCEFSFEEIGEEATLAYVLARGKPPRSVFSFAMATALRNSGFEWRETTPLLAARLLRIAKRAPGFEVDALFVRALSAEALEAQLEPLTRPPRATPIDRDGERPGGPRAPVGDFGLGGRPRRVGAMLLAPRSPE